jgi:hypothetical protein
MRIAIIIDDRKNESLLRFTETKLFFDAKNQSIDFFDDCVVVDTMDEAMGLVNDVDTFVILNTGTFLTTTFRNNHKSLTDKVIIPKQNIIKFDEDTYVGFSKRCKYPEGSKQLYIIENLLKTILRNKELVYLDNTESFTEFTQNPKHLYGLASGWKTVDFARQIGLDNLESITVYDVNLKQLDHAIWLHKHNQLPASVPEYKHVCGEYNPPPAIKDFWQQWHEFPVKFEHLDLFNTPKFPNNSAVWISNIFLYEPTIFKYGWKHCQEAKQRLINTNKESIIFTK